MEAVRPYLYEGLVTLEPSAGMGDFYAKIPEPKKGIDLDSPLFEKVDFLEYDGGEKVVLGNPPFGKNSSLAIKFFNKAATFADIIAFVVPKTFQKQSVHNRLNFQFHLMKEIELPLNSFYTPELEEYAVPTVFQIWEKLVVCREPIIHSREHNDFQFVKTPSDANFAFQRVGANAGMVSIEGLRKSPNSHYFINGDEVVFDILKNIDWAVIKNRTAGNPSISKTELIQEYEKAKYAKGNL